MNMEFRRKLPGPEEVIQMYPVSEESKRQKAKNDEEIRKIFTGESDKLLLVIGPCSADREDAVLDYIAKLAEATREHELITLGLSPRGTLALCRMTKAAAYMRERDYVVPQDVKDVFKDVAAHRMILDSKARYQEKTAREILDEILDSVPEPKVEG